MTRTGSELFNKSTRRSPGTSPADSFKQAQVSPFSWGGCVFPPCLRISVWYSTPAAVHVIGGSSEIWLMPSGFFEKRPACCWRLTLCVVDVLTQMLDDFIWMGFIFHFHFFFYWNLTPWRHTFIIDYFSRSTSSAQMISSHVDAGNCCTRVIFSTNLLWFIRPICRYWFSTDSTPKDQCLLLNHLVRIQRRRYGFFKIDYDRQSAGVTNEEHLQRPLAVCRAEGTEESKALVKCRFITGPSLVQQRESAWCCGLSLCCYPQPPRGGQFGAGLLFGEGSVSDGPDTIIYQSLGARCSGVPSELIAARAGKVEALWPRQEGNEQSERVQRVFIFPGLD